MSGSVSGGCVEGDVHERAIEVLDSGRSVLATYGISDELGFQVGLSCGGEIDVLIERFVADEAWQAARSQVERQRPVALATALAPEELLGRRLAVFDDGTSVGTVDTNLDERLVEEGCRALREEATGTLTLPRSGDDLKVFVEAFAPPPRLYIVGATHVAMPLSSMARELGYRVTVVDARSVYATAERFPEADAVLTAWPDDALAEAALDAYSYVVVLTHDPKFDLPVLQRALRSDARYIGAMGSRKTQEQRKDILRDRGFDEGDLARIRAPIGLDLGGRAPEEIALAILAEMLATRHGRELEATSG